MHDTETAHLQRQLITRAVVRSTNDTAETQTATVTTARHVDRTDAEVIQPFGVASRPPPGGLAIALAVGGDQGDLVLLPIGNPRNRMGKLAEGETAVHNAKGDRVHIKADGTIEAASTKEVIAKVKEAFATVKETASSAGSAMAAMWFAPNTWKMRFKNHYIVINKDGIFSSVAIVVGPDPEPAV